MARVMPPAETRLPLRAVAGEFIRMRPMTNARRARQPGEPDEDLDDAEGGHALGLRRFGRLGRDGLLAEHLEHPVGDDVAADDVHRREGARRRATGPGSARSSASAAMSIAADEDDPVDRVGARHQRRVEGRRDLADDREPDEDREDEDRQRVEQGFDFGGHAGPPAPAAGAGSSSFLTGSDRIAPPWLMTVALVTSSSKSRLRAPSLTMPEQERRDVPGVERGRAGRHRGRQVVRRDDRHAVRRSRRSRRPALSSQLPPRADAAMSTMTEPDFILPTRLRGDQDRRLAARDLGGRDDDVHPADDLVELGLLGGALLGRQLAGVAARPGRVDRRLELDELGAEALGLLARLRPDVVGLDHGAEPARGADRLEPGHADARGSGRWPAWPCRRRSSAAGSSGRTRSPR